MPIQLLKLSRLHKDTLYHPLLEFPRNLQCGPLLSAVMSVHPKVSSQTRAAVVIDIKQAWTRGQNILPSVRQDCKVSGSKGNWEILFAISTVLPYIMLFRLSRLWVSGWNLQPKTYMYTVLYPGFQSRVSSRQLLIEFRFPCPDAELLCTSTIVLMCMHMYCMLNMIFLGIIVTFSHAKTAFLWVKVDNLRKKRDFFFSGDTLKFNDSFFTNIWQNIRTLRLLT